VGKNDGEAEGDTDGTYEGECEGSCVGKIDGVSELNTVAFVGVIVGSLDGRVLGCVVGPRVGIVVGGAVGVEVVGSGVGCGVGAAVGTAPELYTLISQSSKGLWRVCWIRTEEPGILQVTTCSSASFSVAQSDQRPSKLTCTFAPSRNSAPQSARLKICTLVTFMGVFLLNRSSHHGYV
jgi:hypothetical protein